MDAMHLINYDFNGIAFQKLNDCTSIIGNVCIRQYGQGNTTVRTTDRDNAAI